MKVTKSDWKLFCIKLPDWQEAYMDRLNQEYIRILNGEGNPSDRFWALEKRIKEDKKKPGVQCRCEKESMLYVIRSLMYDGAITFEDLSDFSDSVRDAVSSDI